MSLIEMSIEIILDNQAPSGAYIASPNFPPYQYSWFRDGAFIAYAMDLYGQVESATQFFDWSSAVIQRYEKKIRWAVENPAKVLSNSRVNAFHCRFTTKGEEIRGGWSTHQLDGLGTWLWALTRHAAFLRESTIRPEWQTAINLVLAYISSLWRFPCADSWEENEDQLHTYSLAALAGGLQSYQDFKRDNSQEVRISQINKLIESVCISEDGYYKKSSQMKGVDANLLGLFFPFGVVKLDNPCFVRTLTKIEEDLRVPGRGLMRYVGDMYYGGGEWILLSAWLGYIFVQMGRNEQARQIKKWIESQADQDGFLPEQLTHVVQNKAMLREWESKWGPPARPLLWSHANYLILCHALKERGRKIG